MQYIADNISSVKELTDALAKELAIRLTQESLRRPLSRKSWTPGPCGGQGGPGRG